MSRAPMKGQLQKGTKQTGLDIIIVKSISPYMTICVHVSLALYEYGLRMDARRKELFDIKLWTCLDMFVIIK